MYVSNKEMDEAIQVIKNISKKEMDSVIAILREHELQEFHKAILQPVDDWEAKVRARNERQRKEIGSERLQEESCEIFGE